MLPKLVPAVGEMITFLKRSIVHVPLLIRLLLCYPTTYKEKINSLTLALKA